MIETLDFAQTLTDRIGLLLLSDRNPLPRAVIAVRVDRPPHDVGKRLAQLVDQHRVSKAKGRRGALAGSGYSRYFLTDPQATVWRAVEQAERARRAAMRGELIELAELEIADLPARLRFLSELLLRPGFEGNAILTACVGDYQAALRAGTRRERA